MRGRCSGGTSVSFKPCRTVLGARALSLGGQLTFHRAFASLLLGASCVSSPRLVLPLAPESRPAAQEVAGRLHAGAR